MWHTVISWKKQGSSWIFWIFEIFEILSCSFWGENMFRERISCLAHRFDIIHQLFSDLNHDFFLFFKILRRIWREMFQSPSDIAISKQNRKWFENATKNVAVSINFLRFWRKPHVHIFFRSEEEGRWSLKKNEESSFY